MDFPLIITTVTLSRMKKINPKSALQYPSHVEEYLSDEINHGVMLGPFKDPPINDLHISPFMTRDRSSSDKRRVIIDLS